MRSSIARTALAPLGLALLFVCPVYAQWTTTVGLRATRFSGGAEEQGTGRSLLPYRPTVFQVGITRLGGRVGVGLRIHYASSSLGLEGADGVAAVKTALDVYGASPEVTLRIARAGPEGIVRAYAGPILELWKLPDAGSRARLGLAAGVGLEIPFGGRWSGVARVGAAVTPASPFNGEDLEASFTRRTLWRREVSAELGYRM